MKIIQTVITCVWYTASYPSSLIDTLVLSLVYLFSFWKVWLDLTLKEFLSRFFLRFQFFLFSHFQVSVSPISVSLLSKEPFRFTRQLGINSPDHCNRFQLNSFNVKKFLSWLVQTIGPSAVEIASIDCELVICLQPHRTSQSMLFSPIWSSELQGLGKIVIKTFAKLRAAPSQL